MSIASPFGSVRSPSTVDVQTLRTLAVRPVQTTAFWVAVLMPVAYPALMFGGLEGQELPLLAAAFACNAAALIAGRGHDPDRA